MGALQINDFFHFLCKAEAVLAREVEQMGDIVQGDFLDSYRNLSYKNVMGVLWAAEFCAQAEFVVKADDDMFVDLHLALSLAQRYRNTASYTAGRPAN